MNRTLPRISFESALMAVAVVLAAGPAWAATTVFFDNSQTATNLAPGSTTDTLRTSGYLFTYTVDKWWYPTISIGPGTPTGRPQGMVWPNGITAQAITAGPTGMTNGGPAKIVIKRVDGLPFNMPTLTFRLLANTAGAGASLEVMPMLNGEDGLPDPVMLNATGYGGQSFTYNPTRLDGYDTYKMSLYVDFALTGLTLVAPGVPESPLLEVTVASTNQLRFAWPAEPAGFHLQVSDNPASGVFTNGPWSPLVEGDFNVISLPMTNIRQFFRLAY